MSWISLFVLCAVGSIVPGLGTELYLAGASVMLGPGAAATIVLIAAATQTAGKLLVFAGAAAGVSARGKGKLSTRWQRRIERSNNSATAVVFGSALASVPPLYLTAMAIGAGRLGRMRFASAVFAGRLLRYSALVAAPHLFLGNLP